MTSGILIIDDDEDDCLDVQDSLLQIGVKLPIAFAYDGHSAFEMLKNSEELPRLVILDVNMPVMNGFEVLEKLNRDYQIPVILYTTACNDQVKKKALGLGAVDCIQKGTSYADNVKFAKRVSEILRTVTVH
jgi:CheY-like chemotaxis protein